MFVPAPPPEVKPPAEVDAEVEVAADPPVDPVAPEPDEPQGPTQRPDQPTWQTLGSMDPASGHVMLVTLNSRGAGVERIELTQRKSNGRLKYRRVDVRSGYLGYFAADPADTELGLRINVIGPGTPADLAVCADPTVQGGLQVGDRIVGVDQTEVPNAPAFYQWMEKSEPGQQITLQVLRGASDAEAAAEDAESDAEAEGDRPPTGETLQFTAVLTEHPLDLLRLSGTGGQDEVLGNLSRLSCLLNIGSVGRKELLSGQESLLGEANPAELVWNVNEGDAAAADDQPAGGERAGEGVQSVTFRLELSDREMSSVGARAVAVRRSYSLRPGSYLLDMDVQLENLSDQPQSLVYRLEGPNGVTLEGWWYSNKISPNWGGSAARDVVYRTSLEGHELISGYALLKQAKDESSPAVNAFYGTDPSEPPKVLNYVGVDAQYFTVAYLPSEVDTSLDEFRRATAAIVTDPNLIPENKERAVNSSFYLDSQIAELAPGATLRQSVRMFAGPKQPDLLATVGLEDCVYYGWFHWPALLLGHLLHLLSAVGNYAVAIVLLTVIVRGCMFPLSRKAAVNAQRMQELAPELKKIAEKYKDDMEGRIRAQRELQQRVGFNPLAGCLPMFLQLPIFIGLYRTLSVDIELRQAAFASWTTWASNLAAPDMLYFWGDWLWEYLSGRGTGWLGPYFNILPMIVVALFLTQQKMFMPPATDEQTAMTQKMMNYMTLVMGLFFFRVPAGLCIYFITSSLWGIAERIIVKRTLPKTPHFDRSVLEGTVHRSNQKTESTSLKASETTGKGNANGDGQPETWQDKIRKRIGNQPEPPASLPKDRKRPPAKKRRP